MSATYTEPVLPIYRDEITEMVQAGEPFGQVEDFIDASLDLGPDEQAALWLLAFSLRERGDQLQAARGYVEALARAGD